MFGRFGWAEILVIVVLVLILFGSGKIPGMMKNLADGINVFKKEIKDTKKKEETKSENGAGDSHVMTGIAAAPTQKAARANKKTVAKKSGNKSASAPHGVKAAHGATKKSSKSKVAGAKPVAKKSAVAKKGVKKSAK